MRKVELPALTGIRFYAAVVVYLSHIIIIPGMEALAGGRVIFDAGVVGVSFFFALSGFILTYNYADHFKEGVTTATYKRFVWDRFAKIYPVQLAALLLVLPVAIYSPNLPLDWRALPVHALMLQCFWPSITPNFVHYLNVPSWSISCEWFFYLLAPLAMFCAFGKKRRWALVGATTLYAVILGWLLWQSHSDYTRLYFVSWFAPSRFVEFFVGVFLGVIFLSPAVRMPKWFSGMAQVVGIVLIVAGAMYRKSSPWPLHGGLLYLPGSAFIIMGLAYGRGFLTTHLARPWLNRLGMASFCFYMIHAPIIRAMKGVCYHFEWEIRTWSGFSAVTVSMFLVIQTLALIMHYGYEMPVQKVLRSRFLSQAKPKPTSGCVPQLGG